MVNLFEHQNVGDIESNGSHNRINSLSQLELGGLRNSNGDFTTVIKGGCTQP